jgi:hypothetical protein
VAISVIHADGDKLKPIRLKLRTLNIRSSSGALGKIEGPR